MAGWLADWLAAWPGTPLIYDIYSPRFHTVYKKQEEEEEEEEE